MRRLKTLPRVGDTQEQLATNNTMSQTTATSADDKQTPEQIEAEAIAVAGGQDKSKVEVHPKDDSNSTTQQSAPPDREGMPVEVPEDADGTIEMSVTQIDYTTRKKPDGDEYAVLHLFGRTAEQNFEHVQVHDFRPYFYLPAGPAVAEAKDDWRVTDTEDGFESIRGTDVVRCYTMLPKHVGQMRNDFDDHYEADILFPNRFLIDKDIKSGICVPEARHDDDTIVVGAADVEPVDTSVNPRVNMFDIEVEDRNGFPEDGEEPLISITSHDSYDDQYIIWYVDAGEGAEIPDEIENYEPCNGQGELDVDIRVFDDEVLMLNSFLNYINGTNPDVLTGWNFEDFDATYLLDRLDVLNESHNLNNVDLDMNRLSRVGDAYTSNWGPTIKGRVVLDLLYAYKRTQFSELESYRLDAVGEMELGVGKEHYSGKIGDMWEEDPKTLLEYNLRDVEICVELDKKQDIINFWDEVRMFVGCKLEDAPTPSDACDMYVLHKVNDTYVLPSKGQAEYEDYEGGAVFEPISGVAENVSVLDLKSLYPMCMVTINASPETKVENPEEYDGETFRAPNDIHFKKGENGVIREIIDELLAEREEKKGLRNDHEPDTDEYENFDRQQASIKVIMNSLYGVLGWERFRLYDKAMGAAVTATGRGVIEFTETCVEELGNEVTYGDTDSVMLELGQLDDNDLPDIDLIPDKMKNAHPDMSDHELRMLAGCLKKSEEIEEYINDRYDDYAKEKLNADEHRFQIEFEKLYRRFFQAGKKKRYAGHIVWKEGKHLDDIDITGFESERSDIAGITKEVQVNVIEMIVTGAKMDDIKDYVHGVIQQFKEGSLDLDQIGIPGGIGKSLDNYATETAHVRGAKYANAVLGTNFQKGSKPKRLYLKKVHPEFFQRFREENDIDKSITPREYSLTYERFKKDPDVICYEYAEEVPEEFQIDWDKMLNKTLQSPISRVLTPMGITWDDVVSGQTQTGLSNFM